MVCEQCGDTQSFSGQSDAEVRVAISDGGWVPYGTGRTPLAEEWNDGRFQCLRCTEEPEAIRLKRIVGPLVRAVGVKELWHAAPEQGATGKLTIFTKPEATEITFELHGEDSAIREEVESKLAAAYQRR